ncbi:hypothetical protein GHT06_016751 [Daphnia sinensis]|uniref:Receptor expression-enhancing protein n=1 Tax=Daphnia sinensis TaxID=1820382 RepID=A0AAD5KQN8_9CRUS|nr:hypothetical protein GHT06_016751 [Daphnia sinensis]
MTQFLEQYRAGLEKMLYEPGFINNLLAKAEERTGVKRLYIALGMVGVISIYLTFGYGAQLLCNSIGFVYPAYASVKAIESDKKDDDTKWLTYWTVFAFFSIIEFFSDILLSWFPLYWLAKCILLVWCFAPVSWNGSAVIYQRIIRPRYLKYNTKLDKVVGDAASNAAKLLSQGLDITHNLVKNANSKDE